MSEYLTKIRQLYQAHADPAAAAPMTAYMRGQFAYFGLKSALCGQLHHQAIAQWGIPSLQDLDPVLRELWSQPERELQYFAISLLRHALPTLPHGWTPTLEYLITHKSWWDTVDTIAIDLVGAYFQRFPDERDAALPAWRASDNLWLRRTALLFQHNYKNATDFPLLKEIIRENLGSREFFINKAIGWILRAYSRTDPQAVRDFVAETPLQPLSRREALKWLDAHPDYTPKSKR